MLYTDCAWQRLRRLAPPGRWRTTTGASSRLCRERRDILELDVFEPDQLLLLDAEALQQLADQLGLSGSIALRPGARLDLEVGPGVGMRIQPVDIHGEILAFVDDAPAATM